MLKKLIAGTLSILICSSAVTSTNVVDLINNNTKQDSSNSVSNENDYKLQSSNSLGNYITAMAEANNTGGSNESDNSEKNFTISNLDFDDKTGKILIQSTQTSDCKAVVSFIDDITCESVLEKVVNVNEGNSTISEETVNTLSLPEFYLVKAQLIDESGNVLSPVFTFNKYTKEMQEILAADIYDFNEDYVVNFDEREDTNFIVLNEETVIADSSETQNTLISADYDNNVYVFDNADDDIKSLESGKYLYVQPNENDIIAVSVEDVEINDNQVTVKGDSENIDNMFDFMKFESITENDEVTYDTSICDEDIEYEEGSLEKTGKLCFNLQKLSNKLASFSGSASQSFSYSHDFETANNCINVAPSLKFELKQEFNFYKKWSYINISFNLDNSLSLSLSVKASLPEGHEIEKDIAKATIPTGIPGVAIQSTVKLCLEIEGSFSVEYTTTTSRGFIYDSDTGYEPIEKDCTDNNKLSAKAQGTVFAGIKLSVAAVLIDEKIASFGIEAKIGIEITGELENTAAISGESTQFCNKALYCDDISDDTCHACDTCLNGEINFVASGGIKLSVLTHDFELTLASLSVKITDWYLSIDNEASGMSLINGMLPATWLSSAKNTKFGFGTCPNVAYKTTFNIFENTSGKKGSLSKVYITVDDKIFLSTDLDGNAALYCKNGSHSYKIYIFADKVAASGTFNINNATKNLSIGISYSGLSGSFSGTVSNDSNGSTITLPAASTNSINRNIKPTKVTTSSDMKITESGSLGDNITYILYNDGSLFINGYGETYDFSKSPFSNPKNVREVIFENRDEKNNKVITGIGNAVFKDCTNLDVVYLSNFIEKIGNNTFDGCLNLKYFRYNGKNDKTTNLRLPDNLISIGDYAFNNCTFKSLVIPSGIIKIGSYAFNNCSSAKIENVTFSKSALSIGKYAFANCKGLINISIPLMESIGSYAFSGCTSLKTAVIKEGIGSIGENTFNECIALQSLTLPYAGLSLTAIEKDSFPLSKSLFNKTISDGTYSVTGNSNYGIPKTLTSITITGGQRIPNNAFYGMSSLKTINLPNSITSIGNYAFYGCSSMESAKLPSKLTSIGNYAFANCSSAKFGTVSIPSSVITIGNYAFSGCKGFTNVIIPGTVKTLGSYAFSSCTSLKTAVIKEGIGSIGENTFNECIALQSLTLPYAGLSLTAIEKDSFPLSQYLFNKTISDGTYSATGNSSYGIPKTLTSITITGGQRIPNKAFYGMSRVETINLPNSITNIGNYAFYGCSSMESAKLPSKLTSIGNYAFANCSSAKFGTVSIPSSVITIGNYAFSGCKGFTNVIIPGTVKTLGSYAFSSCTSLKTAVIKEGIGSIGENTFNECIALQSLTLPYAGLSLTAIEKDSFPLSQYLFNKTISDGTYSATGNSSYGIPKTLTSITITGGQRIPNKAFYGMSRVETINLPNSITSIGNYAFYNCTGLSNLYIDKTSTDWANVNIGLDNNIIYVVNKIFNSISIKTQPKSATVAVNSTAKFTVKATGDNLKYQWQYSKDNGENWMNLNNTSSTTDTLNLVAAANRNNFLVRCVIKDVNGFTVVSKAAKLTIKTKLEITKQPESVTAEVNKTAEFTIEATGDNLKYQWQYSKDNGENWMNLNNTSSTTDTLNLVAAANRNNFLVRCAITDEYGESIESASAVLTVAK